MENKKITLHDKKMIAEICSEMNIWLSEEQYAILIKRILWDVQATFVDGVPFSKDLLSDHESQN